MIARALTLVGLAGLLGVLAGCGGGKPTSAPTTEPGPKPAITPAPAPAADPHEFDPAKHVIPTAAATGRLKGKPFTPDRVELEGEHLRFGQGKDFFADLSVEIMLGSKAHAADGLKLVVRPSQKWSDGVPDLLISVGGGKGLPDTKFINDGYAMTLELAKAEKGKSAGKIYLVLPDAEKSYLAGTFTAVRKRSMSEPPGEEEVPFIQGTVTPPLTKGQMVTVGYVGLPAGGKNPISDAAGSQVFGDNGSGGGTRSMTFKPRMATLRFDKFTPKYDFSNLPPGRYLIFARIKDGPAAWNWVDVAAGGQVNADIKLDAVKTGTVEVKLPPDQNAVRLVPADLMPPPGDAFIDQLVFSLGLEGTAKDGKVTIKNVPAGKYQARAGNLRGDVEVTSGKTATVELKAAKK